LAILANYSLHTISSHELTRAQLAEVIALCSEVFHLDYAFYMDLCPDRVHVLGYADGYLAAHALWLDRRLWVGNARGLPLRGAYVEGMCTHADHRRRGYGSALMRRLQEEIVRAGYELAALSPARVDWYERLGWVRWRGPLFIERDGVLQATPDDCVLVYPTPRSEGIDVQQPLIAEWRPFELW